MYFLNFLESGFQALPRPAKVCHCQCSKCGHQSSSNKVLQISEVRTRAWFTHFLQTISPSNFTKDCQSQQINTYTSKQIINFYFEINKCKFCSSLYQKLSFSSSPVELHKILAYIHQLPPVEKEEDCIADADYLLELLISRHEKRKSQQERVNEMPLYPTEKIIWDENIVPVEYFSGEGNL